MIPYFENAQTVIYHGDCQEIVPTLSGIDSVITDPPYGLRFMGKRWDYDVPTVERWQAITAAVKPGAILLSFGGTRTYHRVVVNIEDAGWEIRDCVMWLYGSGFPKSHDISKAIDKEAGAVPVDMGVSPNWRDSKRNREKDGRMEVRGANAGRITAPATDAARKWDGYGTALKPAYEPIVVAMKPLDGTYAQNAQKYGVAGLWVDGARIDAGGTYDAPGDRGHSHRRKRASAYGLTAGRSHAQGRWPANVIHDGSEEVLELMPKTATHAGMGDYGDFANKNTYGDGWTRKVNQQADSGSAARFFYCAKASRKERSEGNDHPTVKPIALMRYLCRLTRTPDSGVVLDPFMGSGSTLIAAQQEGRRAIGIDKDEHACEIAARRLSGRQVARRPRRVIARRERRR